MSTMLLEVFVYKTSPRIDNPLWQVWDQFGESFPEWANEFYLSVREVNGGTLVITLSCAEKPGDPLIPYTIEVTIFDPKFTEILPLKLWALYISHKRRILKAYGEWYDSVTFSPETGFKFSGGE